MTRITQVPNRFFVLVLSFVIIIGSMVNFGAVTAHAAGAPTAPTPSGSGTTYYISSSGGSDTNAGTAETTPWKTLARAGQQQLNPGDRLLLKRGDAWIGETLEPKGSGAPGNEILIDAYGNSNDPKPIINGSGYLQAVLLYGEDYIAVQNLELINDDSLPYLVGSPSEGPAPAIVMDPAHPELDPRIRTGNNALMMTAMNNWHNVIARVDVQPNTDYTYTVYAKGTGTFNMVVKKTDENTSIIPAYVPFTLSTNKTMDWQPYTIHFNSGQFDQVLIYLSDTTGSNIGDIIYFDDASVIADNDASQTNLVVNPSFEVNPDDSTDGWRTTPNYDSPDYNVADWVNKPNTGWLIQKPSGFASVTRGMVNESGGDTTPSAPAVDVHGGTNAMQLVSNGDSSSNSGYGSDITVAPNTEYTFSAWIKGNADILLGVYWPGNGWTATQSPPSIVPDPNAWTHVSFNFTTGSDATTDTILRPFIKEWGTAGTVYIDDMTLTATGSTDNLIPNPGFEDSDSFASSGWWDATGFSIYQETSAPVVQSSNVHSGSKSVELVQPGTYGTEGYDAGGLGFLTVEPNTDYVIGTWVKGAGSFALGLNDDSWSPIDQPVFTGTDDWTYVEATINTGNHTLAGPFIKDWGGSTHLFFDDVSLTKVGGDGTNLWPDPGFEGTPSKWWVTPAFTLFTETPPPVIPSTNVHSGSKSVELVKPGAYGAEGYNAADLGFLAVVPNTDYVIGAWVKGEGKFALGLNDDNWSPIDQPVFSGTDDWTYVKATINTGDHTLAGPFIKDWGGSTNLFFDDVSLTKVGGDGTNLWPDSGFEETPSKWWTTDAFTLYTDSTVTPPSGEVNEQTRRGISVIAPYGSKAAYNNITIRNLDIHDVDGISSRDNQWWSGAIYIMTDNAINSTDTTNTPYFVNLLIENNYAYDLTTYGVYVNMDKAANPVTGEHDGGVSHYNDNLIIRNNVIRNTGVDAICVGFSNNPLTENNATYDVAQNSEKNSWIGGIWTYASDSSVTQYNEVARIKSSGGGSIADSQSFDLDVADTGTHVIQFNYSHDNGGGFVLFFGDANYDASIVRYNVSQNDHTQTFDHYNIKVNTPNNYLYNNVFYSDGTGQYDGIAIKPNDNMNTFFENNIFVSAKEVDYPAVYSYSNNLYATPGTNSGSVNDPNGVFANPLMVAPGTAKDVITSGFGDSLTTDALRAAVAGYKLKDGSPGNETGKPISLNTIMQYFPNADSSVAATGMDTDFFGTPLSATTRNIGIYESPATTPVEPETPAITVNGHTVDIPSRVNGNLVTVGTGTSDELAVILNNASGNGDIVIDLTAFGNADIDFILNVSQLKNINRNVELVTKNGTYTVKSKALWNNSGKARVISLRNGSGSFKNQN